MTKFWLSFVIITKLHRKDATKVKKAVQLSLGIVLSHVGQKTGRVEVGATQCWWQIVTCLNMLLLLLLLLHFLLLLLLLLPLSQGWLHQSLRLQTARLFIDPSEQLENDTLGPRAKTFQCTLIKRVGQAIIVTKKQLWLSFPNEQQTNTRAGCLHRRLSQFGGR